MTEIIVYGSILTEILSFVSAKLLYVYVGTRGLTQSLQNMSSRYLRVAIVITYTQEL